MKVRRATIGLAWGLLLAPGGCLDVPDASESADTGIMVDAGDDDGGADRASTGGPNGDGAGDGADADKLDVGGGGVGFDLGGGRDDSTGTDTGTSSGSDTGLDTETSTTGGTDTGSGTDSGSSSTG